MCVHVCVHISLHVCVLTNMHEHLNRWQCVYMDISVGLILNDSHLPPHLQITPHTKYVNVVIVVIYENNVNNHTIEIIMMTTMMMIMMIVMMMISMRRRTPTVMTDSIKQNYTIMAQKN